MKIDMHTPNIHQAVGEIFINGDLYKNVTKVDTDAGFAEVYPTMPDGSIGWDTKIVRGKIDVYLKDGWSWDNIKQCFVHHTPAVEPPKKFKMRNFRET